MNSRTLQISLIVFLSVFIAVLSALIILDRTRILPLDRALSFLPFSSQSQTSGKAVPSQTSSFALAELTPVPSGDPFTAPVRGTGDKSIALFTVNGVVQDIDHRDNNKTYLAIIKTNGEPVNEILPLAQNAQITIVTVQNGQTTQTEGTNTDIQIGDAVIVSYNINTDNTNQNSDIGEITGVRITRYRFDFPIYADHP